MFLINKTNIYLASSTNKLRWFKDFQVSPFDISETYEAINLSNKLTGLYIVHLITDNGIVDTKHLLKTKIMSPPKQLSLLVFLFYMNIAKAQTTAILDSNFEQAPIDLNILQRWDYKRSGTHFRYRKHSRT